MYSNVDSNLVDCFIIFNIQCILFSKKDYFQIMKFSDINSNRYDNYFCS